MRSNKLRSVQAIIAITAVFVLTGAKGGCGGGGEGDGDGGEPPPPPPCEPGYHLETICDDTCNGGECFEQCVPDTPCPPDTYEQWTCYDEPIPVEDDAGGEQSVPPDGGNCFLECVPLNPCGDGWHEEWVCEPAPPPEEGGDDSRMPTEECYPLCVPDSGCGPDEYEEWICEEEDVDGDGNIDGGGCYPICVPIDNCGEGAHEEWICDDVGSCSHDKCVEGPALGAECDPAVALICSVDPFCCESFWDGLCVAEVESVAGEICSDPGQYPPSPPQECYPVCVPDEQPCPPGQHLEFVCEGDEGMREPDQCQEICVDDEVYQF
jgi:hypothetical protein